MHIQHDHDNRPDLLVRRFDDNNGIRYYFSLLSTDKGSQNKFAPRENLYLPLASIFSNRNVYVAGSHDGWLCLYNSDKVVLWDPSTNHFQSLPQSTVKPVPNTSWTNYHTTGFGYDSPSQDGKVVRFLVNFMEDNRFGTARVELYSLKSNSWKELTHPKVTPFFSVSAYVNGIYYWAYWPREGESEYSSIVSFDFAHEEFSFLDLPMPLPCGGSRTFELVEFDGSLGVIVYPRLGIDKSFELWVRKQHDSWTKEFVAHVPGAHMPLGFYSKDELFLHSINYELLLLDRAAGNVKNLGIFEHPSKIQLVRLNGRAELGAQEGNGEH